VAVAVVDRLEMIDVEGKHGQRPEKALRSLHLAAGQFMEATPVVETSQRVGTPSIKRKEIFGGILAGCFRPTRIERG
jgi:hypothetical protein